MLDLRSYTNRHSSKNRMLRFLWQLVWLFLFKLTPSLALNGWRCALLRLFGADLRATIGVSPTCRVWAPWNLHIGEFVSLGQNVDLYSVSPITIGSQVVISRDAYICTASHDISSSSMELTYKPIVIGSYVWIAAKAFVGPGVTIGEGAVVGACAVVTKDVEPWTVVAGNPAKFIKKRVIVES